MARQAFLLVAAGTRSAHFDEADVSRHAGHVRAAAIRPNETCLRRPQPQKLAAALHNFARAQSV